MSDEQHLALPQLFGAPAYSRPPRPVQELVRPFDPDELPLEAERTEVDLAYVDELNGTTWAPPSPPAAKAKGIRRSKASKLAKSSPLPAGPVAASTSDTSVGLQGRPFSLRNLGRIFGGDHK